MDLNQAVPKPGVVRRAPPTGVRVFYGEEVEAKQSKYLIGGSLSSCLICLVGCF